MYEINTWVWLEELSARSGRPVNLGSVPAVEWDALAQLGFDAVWFMGVWERRSIDYCQPGVYASGRHVRNREIGQLIFAHTRRENLLHH